jgi:hypothetical protein
MPQNLITVSLCGKEYKVPLHILLRSKYFTDIFDEYPYQKEIFIPRSPLAFEHILTCLINNNYKVPFEFKEDLDYYFLDREIKKDPFVELSNQIHNIQTFIENSTENSKTKEEHECGRCCKPINDEDFCYCKYCSGRF